MNKVVSLMLVFSVVFMGFATTFAQGASFNTYASGNTEPMSFDTLPFGAELSANELAQIEGEQAGRVLAEGVKFVGKALAGGLTYDGAKKGAKPASRSLDRYGKWHSEKTYRKCMATPRRCAD